ncbi:MAG: hypothetical protein U0637_09175 [Phycisphaerales bacterium]
MALDAQGQVIVHDVGTLPGQSASMVYGISADASTVFGISNSPASDRGFIWRLNSGIEDIGSTLDGVGSKPYDSSADGGVLVGSIYYVPYGFVPLAAMRWTPGGGVERLASLAGVARSFARTVSRDGQVIAGLYQYTNDGPNHTFIWTSATGMVDFAPPAGSDYVMPQALNDDGTVLVGYSTSQQDGDRAVRWVSGTGFQELGAFPGSSYSYARSVSRDGQVVTGNAGFPRHAFRWTGAAGMVRLDTNPDWHESTAEWISADGRVIVGYGRPTSTSPQQAMIWDEHHGMQTLWARLTDLGTDLADWTSLDYALGTSEDGSAIVGWAMRGTTDWRSFAVRSTPQLQSHPSTTSTCWQGNAVFRVVLMDGIGTPRFRWQAIESNGSVFDLEDGAIPGTSTLAVGTGSPTLTLTSADLSSARLRFQCRITSSCGQVVSQAAELFVSTCDCTDFNADGLFPDTADLDDYLSVFSGGPCSNDPNCGDTDFNNDGLFPDTADIDSLLSVFSGGACL